MTRSAKEYLASLKDDRTIFINGERVADVTAITPSATLQQSMAGLFDFANAPVQSRADDIRHRGGGGPTASGSFPTSYDGARGTAARRSRPGRRCMLASWAALPTMSPPASPACYMGLECSKAYDPARAGALEAYYRYARDNDLYLTYVIINPQADRSKEAAEQADPFLTAGVVDRDAEGITIRGAKMLATGGVVANEVFVTSIQPMQPGEERYAMSFAIPMNTKGLKMLSRKSYEAARRRGVRQSACEPLRRERRRPLLRRRQGSVGSRLHRWQRRNVPEAVSRDAGARLPELSGDDPSEGEAAIPDRHRPSHRRDERHHPVPAGPRDARPTRRRGGMVDAFVAAMEAKGTQVGAYFIPDRHTLYAAQVLTQQLYPQDHQHTA